MKLNNRYGLMILGSLSILVISSCSSPEPKENQTLDNNILIGCNDAIKTAIVTDRITPPVASRRYFYANVASYEALVPFYNNYQSMAGQLKGLKPLDLKPENKVYCIDAVAFAAHTFVSNRLVYQKDSIESFRDRTLEFYKKKLHPAVLKRSVAFGDSIGAKIIAWAKKDSFNITRGMRLFEISNKTGAWEPTHPDFMDAIEPNWRYMRTAVVSTPSQFKLEGPIPYNENKGSDFYKQCMEVYTLGNGKNDSLLKIAQYWDDAPVSTEHIGHATIKHLKVSPGGHWVNIFGNMARQNKFTLIESADGFMRVSAAIYDGFIVCWDAKYKYDYIRPITAIRKLIDSTFSAPIQTPAFPEYPSGHSTVSGAASATLTMVFGDKAFTDSTEYEFNLGIRYFKNFTEAAEQASVSRLYGGIHFRTALDHGLKLGREIAAFHATHLITKKK